MQQEVLGKDERPDGRDGRRTERQDEFDRPKCVSTRTVQRVGVLFVFEAIVAGARTESALSKIPTYTVRRQTFW